MASSPIYGVDFSGSATPGDVIWIAEGRVTDAGTVEVIDTESAKSRGWGRARDAVYSHLEEFIASRKESVFGLDVPLGFPENEVDADGWEAFLNGFHAKFDGRDIDVFPGILQLEGHPKREDDVRYGGQSPFSPQVRYMVFFGLRDLLHPLVTKKNVSVRPMGSVFDGCADLVEVYPAATFGRHGLYRSGYKRGGDVERCRRRINFEGLNELDNVRIDKKLKPHALDSDDALDSICAAVATGHAVMNGIKDPPASVEGHIYV